MHILKVFIPKFPGKKLERSYKQTRKMGEGGKWGFHLNSRSECFGDLRIQQHFGKLKISFQMILVFFWRKKWWELMESWEDASVAGGGLIQKQLNSELIVELISPIGLSVRSWC